MIEKNKKIIAIIPARGGSKGIRRKNVRLLAGKPLIAYSIEKALKSKYISDVVVSTDNEEIAEISKIYGSLTIKRPKVLAEDMTPLDPVIVHAVKEMEKKKNLKYDLIVTIQPTSPLLSLETLDKAIKIMLAENYDTLLPVAEKTHLYWIKKGKNFKPIYKKRVNRQYLEPIYQERGTPLIASRKTIESGSRIGKKKFIFEIPNKESIDIDEALDWKLVETLLNKLKIVFRVDAGIKMGTGHVCRILALADRLRLYHEVIFLVENKKYLAIKKIKEENHKIITFRDEKDFFKKIRKITPHIVINDILNTNKQYIEKLKKTGYFVVNFDDLGEGSKIADLVINAIYEEKPLFENHYYGYEYMCLRDEFSIFRQEKKTNKKVKNILVTFGGSDPNNLTLLTLQAIEKLKLKNILINIILGIGYKKRKKIYEYIQNLKNKGFKINIKENIKLMAQEIYKSDIVITSNGITVYEVTTMKKPCISIAQNEVEKKHSFAQKVKYIKYLGLAKNISLQNIAIAIKELVNNYNLREKIKIELSKFDSSKGVDKVLRLILNNYYEQK